MTASFPTPDSFFQSFKFEKVLNQDPNGFWILGTAIPVGTKETAPALLRLAQTPTSPSSLESLSIGSSWSNLEMMTTNDIYATMNGSLVPGLDGTGIYQISVICPATDKHIKKYTPQGSKIIRETPKMYDSIVEPYINALPPSVISWVYAILDGTAEAEAVIYRDEDPVTGFIVTPDLKWDKTTLAALYLLVIPLTRSIRSIRDLTVEHLPLLRKIKVETERNARIKYGVESGQLRMFVHYQPSYYHFHVHVTHISNTGFMGSTVGQAHLLADLIDNLELAAHAVTPYYRTRTLEYSLGENHALFDKLNSAQKA